MNLKFIVKTTKISRRALAVFLCLMIVLQGFIQAYGADADSVNGGYCSYEWTLIENEKQLREYQEKGKTDQDAGRQFIEKDGNRYTNDDDINHWFKVLIAYKHGDQYYFCSGSQMVDDGEDYAASRVLANYFYDENGNPQQIGDKVLNSTSGLFAPYIKYQGEENDDPRVYVRFAEAGTVDGKPAEVLSSRMLIGSLSWYGIAHHACAYAEFVNTSAASPDGRTHGAACSHSNYNEFILKWNSNKTVQMYFCPSGSGDRYWTHKGYNIELTQDSGTQSNEFYLYFGVPTINRLIDQSIKVESMTTTYNTTIITENSFIEIPRGSCVVMDGLSKLNGSILVNGGALIIKGTLDTSSSVNVDRTTSDYLCPGSIRVTNGGTLYVEDTGVLCLRLVTSNLIADNGGTIRIDGGCAVAGRIDIKDGSLTVDKGAALIHGASISELTAAQSLGKEGIEENKSKSLDCFMTPFAGTIVAAYKEQDIGIGKLTVGSNGSFCVYGLYYINPSTVADSIFATNAVVKAQARTNYHATISSMMWQW